MKSIFKDRKITIFIDIFQNLPNKLRFYILMLIIGLCIFSLIETITYGSVALFVSVINDSNIILKSSYINIFKNTFLIKIIQDQMKLIMFIGIISIITLILKNICSAIIKYYTGKFVSKVDAFIGEKVLNGFLYMQYEWHLTKNSADLIIAVDWRRFIGSALLKYFITLINNIFLVIVMIITLLYVSPLISLFVLLFMIFMGGIVFIIFRKPINNIGKKNMTISESANREITKALHGYKEVKIYSREKSFLNNYKKNVKSLIKVQALNEFLINAPVMVLEIIGFTTLIFSVIIMLFFLQFSIAEATGTIVLLAVLSWKILNSVSKVVATISQIQGHIHHGEKSLNYLKDINQYMKKQESISEHLKDKVIFSDNIKFENAYFFYQGSNRQVLSNINLTIDKGKTVGIIGHSGSGKSTFVDIILKLLQLSKGNIKIDGTTINNFQNSAWLSLIGYVSQFPYICDGTLAENIAFGLNNDEIDRERVIECCKMAAISDFLSELSNGIDTKIGERGIKLSGGQRQRVSIARALYLEPEILIFDEATSSLDTKSEKSIQKTIYSFKGKKTLIIIAHRLTTVEDCDSIIWIEKGEIKKIGKPSQILPLYKKLYK